MKKIFKSIISYITPQSKSTIGLTSFRIKKQITKTAPKPKLKEAATLKFSLLHK